MWLNRSRSPKRTKIRTTPILVPRPKKDSIALNGSSQQKQNSCFRESIPVLRVNLKRGYFEFWLFFKIGLCLSIPFKRPRQELSMDAAELRSMLKNIQSTGMYHPHFSFTPKTGISFPKTGVSFLLWFFFTLQNCRSWENQHGENVFFCCFFYNNLERNRKIRSRIRNLGIPTIWDGQQNPRLDENSF